MSTSSPIHCANCGEARREEDVFCSCGATRPPEGWAAEAPPPMMMIDDVTPGPTVPVSVGGYELVRKVSDQGRILRWVGEDRRRRQADLWLFSVVPSRMMALEAMVRAARAVRDPGLRHPASWGRTPVGVSGTWFVAVPRGDGDDLSALRAGGKVTPVQAVELFVGASGAVASLHEAGLFLGGLSAEDLILDKERLRVPSFALLLSEEVGRRPGQFSPPEAFEGERSWHADIYALGVMLHGLATGSWSWDALTPPAERPQLPVIKGSWSLTHVIWSMTSPDPDQRPPARTVDQQLRGVYEEMWRSRR